MTARNLTTRDKAPSPAATHVAGLSRSGRAPTVASLNRPHGSPRG